MFSKLAFHNAGRSVRDYGVWFLTMVLAVCLFYVFNALETQTVIRFLSQSSRADVVQAIRELINMLSAFVWVVLAFLILYASAFLIRRRKKELGIYLLLGVERRQVAGLLLAETALLGAAALAVGLALGVLAAQGLSLFTAGLFAVPMTYFAFSISLPALVKTALAFAAIFLLVMAGHALAVSRCRLIDLMKARRVNQSLARRGKAASLLQFLAGAVMLLTAYAMLLTRGLLVVDALFWVMIALGAAGTLLFFRALSGFLLGLCRKNKALYYKGLNLFVLRQFNACINTTYRSMTVICLLLLLALGITASSVGLNSTVEQMVGRQSPRDAQLTLWAEEGEAQPDLPQLLRQAGFNLDERCAAWYVFPVRFVQDRGAVVDEEDAQAMEALWGEKEAARYLEEEGLDVGAAGPEDSVIQWCLLADYAGDKQDAEAAFQGAVETLGREYGCWYTTRQAVWLDTMGTKVLVLFIGLYLGVVFLLTAAAVLALQQITQAADSVPRYQVLARLGAPEKMRRRAVDMQVFLSFFLPLALALVHAGVGITAANQVIAQVGRVDAAASIGVTALLLLAVYGGYFLATCWGSRRVLREK